MDEKLADIDDGPQIPTCCRVCAHYDWEFNDWVEGGAIHHCLLNIYFPTVKQSCKRQKPMGSA